MNEETNAQHHYGVSNSYTEVCLTSIPVLFYPPNLLPVLFRHILLTASAKENKVKTQELRSCLRRLFCMSKKSPDLRSEDLGPGLSLCGVICEVRMAAPALWTPWCLTRIKKRKLQKQCLTRRFFIIFKL